VHDISATGSGMPDDTWGMNAQWTQAMRSLYPAQ